MSTFPSLTAWYTVVGSLSTLAMKNECCYLRCRGVASRVGIFFCRTGFPLAVSPPQLRETKVTPPAASVTETPPASEVELICYPRQHAAPRTDLTHTPP